jgi:hypothetical protein
MTQGENGPARTDTPTANGPLYASARHRPRALHDAEKAWATREPGRACFSHVLPPSVVASM